MSETEEAAARDSYDTQIDDGSGAVHTGSGDVIHIENIELATTRAADTLRRLLSTDEEARTQLLEVLQQLSSLQAQLEEWKELHHILHDMLASFSPFYADLRALSYTDARPTSGRALLRGWRPCQIGVDRLLDFESRVEHIQLFSRGERTAPSRPDWGAHVASFRREMEDRLREDRWSAEGLIDLADEFNYACDCYLSLADRELRRVVEKVQRLSTHLLGGLL
jgi:hypothetical protein